MMGDENKRGSGCVRKIRQIKEDVFLSKMLPCQQQLHFECRGIGSIFSQNDGSTNDGLSKKFSSMNIIEGVII